MSNRLPIRRPTRMREYDYARPGAYFVTITARAWAGAFSTVGHDAVVPTPAGEIVSSVWRSLPVRFLGAEIDEFIAMPDHVHGILLLSGAADAMNRAPTLGEMVRVFKAASTRALRIAGYPDFVWQRNYYEHIVRNDTDLKRVRQYIRENPAAFEHKGEGLTSKHSPP